MILMTEEFDKYIIVAGRYQPLWDLSKLKQGAKKTAGGCI